MHISGPSGTTIWRERTRSAIKLLPSGGAPGRPRSISSSRTLRSSCGIRTEPSRWTARPLPGVANILAFTGVGFLAGLVFAAPLTGATIGALLGSAGSAAAAHAGMDEGFIRDVEAMMKPGTSALFVLDQDVDMEVILHKIRGLGGTVLNTNVNPDRVKLIQSTLAAASPEILHKESH